MGAIRDFLFPQVQTAKPIKVSDVAAALTPVQISDSVYNILGGATNTTRQLAMSVPSVARASPTAFSFANLASSALPSLSIMASLLASAFCALCSASALFFIVVSRALVVLAS